MAELECPECSAHMVLRKSKHGKFYGCSRYPNCDATHGAHPDGKPLGIPANRATKDARMAAHDSFEMLWGPYNPMERSEAYAWLAEQLEMTSDECHIGRFDEATCNRVIDLVEEYLA